MRLFPKEVDTRELSPITLAFVGDGVFELMVREYLASEANRPPNALHRMAVSMVRAEAQAKALDTIMPVLSEKEVAVYKRGRNAHTARNSDDYHKATGLEALFGYLYLSDQTERIQELFKLIIEEKETKTGGNHNG